MSKYILKTLIYVWIASTSRNLENVIEKKMLIWKTMEFDGNGTVKLKVQRQIFYFL